MAHVIEMLFTNIPYWLAQALEALLAAGIGVIIALIAHAILFRVLHRIARASENESDDIVVSQITRPTRYAMAALGIVFAAYQTEAVAEVWEMIAGFVMPALIGWIALALLNALVKAMELRADISAVDNRNARRRQTRLSIFSRIASFVVIFITVGLMLLAIPGVREIGVTLVASAGLAGLAVGAAAQPALKSLIAGLQMALTEPINIDDVVILDGEFGRVEDIRTTYVVVRLWDERRLVVPTSKFLDETVENWTRESSQILGTVLLHLDPLVDVGSIRAEFERQVTANDLWDGRVQSVAVTDTSPDAIQVRLLMSARDAGTAFDLRCAMRESMLAWIRENQPEAIVRRRVEPTGPMIEVQPQPREAVSG